ncbi:MAG TPA: arginine--tRNA ligase, partial [Candidatus Eisenbacteria bacterium]|nr:arginine--tRNA ligase [Candidatus Eisenbacteria bacterium]
MKEEILKKLKEVVGKLTKEDINIQLSIPKDISNGDFTTNVAFQLGKLSGIHSAGSGQKSPLEMAQEIVKEFNSVISSERSEAEKSHQGGDLSHSFEMTTGIEKIEAVQPGFINFYLSTDSLSTNLQDVLNVPEKVALTSKLKNKKMMVEFAHPNTHKELHIGHMRTLTTGESVARILEGNGATVFRANYQGDIGPHVAKAMYGVQKMMQEQNLTLEEIEKWSYSEKAHFLGLGYARGSKEYEEGSKEVIDMLNTSLYKREPEYQELYKLTRKWSLDYYDEFYKRFYTKFDKLFF